MEILRFYFGMIVLLAPLGALFAFVGGVAAWMLGASEEHPDRCPECQAIALAPRRPGTNQRRCRQCWRVSEV